MVWIATVRKSVKVVTNDWNVTSASSSSITGLSLSLSLYFERLCHVERTEMMEMFGGFVDITVNGRSNYVMSDGEMDE